MKDRKKRQRQGDPSGRESPDPRGRFRDIARTHDTLILFVLIFVVYNTVTSINWSGDVVPAMFLPMAILLHHTVSFDALGIPGISDPSLAYAFPVVNGYHYSWFPIVTPVLSTPLYALSYALALLTGSPVNITYLIPLAKTVAAIIAALSCVFVYLAAKDLFSRNAALATTLVYAFATSTWSVSSQAPWQHGTVELLLSMMIWLVIGNERIPSRRNIVLLGILAGLFVFNRPPEAMLLIPLAGYVIWYERKNLPLFGTAAAAAGLPFLLYNFLIFGSVLGGYQGNLPVFSFGIASLANFAGLLIAPNVGLFIYSPVLVLSVLGYVNLNSIAPGRIRQLLVAFGPAIVLEIFVYCFFSGWDASVAYSYGQRYLTGFLPVLAIYLGIVISSLGPAERPDMRVQALRTAFVVLVVLSVAIQAIGVFLYPFNPDRGSGPEKTWDWTRPLIIESFTYGISRISEITVYSFPPLPPLFHYTFSPPGK